MKKDNKPNRRFCDEGDVFYYNREDAKFVIRCTKYYKSTYMRYAFSVFLSAKDPEFGKSNATIGRKTFFRDTLDVLWEDNKIFNLTEKDKAHEILLGVDI